MYRIPEPDGERGSHSHMKFTRVDTDRMVAPKSPKPTARQIFAGLFFGVTIGAGLGAIALESMGHLLADLYSDPIPHAGYISAYLAAVLFPIFIANQLKRETTSPLMLAIAVAGNSLSLLMSGMMSIALVPILPIALIASIFLIGLLGMSPYFLFGISINQMLHLRERIRESGLPATHGLLPAVLTVLTTASFLFIQPFASGYLLRKALQPGQLRSHERSTLDTLHKIGGDSALLTLSYRTPLPIWEAMGSSFANHELIPDLSGGRSRIVYSGEGVKSARRLYFLSTGKPYSSGSVPWAVSNHRSAQWINNIAMEEVGGTRVGSPVPGLSLASLSGTGVLDRSTATGEMEWTMIFRNDGDTDNEARAEILLPPGAVAHQVSLWIKDKERPAAFGPQATVRRAYQEVAVVQRRDPLLVTMPVPGKLFVQCFPVPAHQTMKIRLGVTIPLTPDPADRQHLSLAYPAFGPTNFTYQSDLKNTLTLRDADTSNTPTFPLTLPTNIRWSEKAATRKPVTLYVAFDTGSSMADVFGKQARDTLQQAIQDLPIGSQIYFLSADDAIPHKIDSANSAQTFFRSLPFEAGIDAVPGLTHIVKNDLDKEGILLFLHGPVPNAVSDPAPLATAVKALAPLPDGRPRFYSLLLTPNAPDMIGDRLAMQRNARAYSTALFGGDNQAALSTVTDILSRGESLNETNVGTYDGDNRRYRLRAYQNALAVWYTYSNFGPEALAAARTMAKQRLVTPLSGAVVLEAKEDYKKHGLDDGEKEDSSKDTLVAPEPGTLLLLSLGGVGLFAWRRRSSKCTN